jgi:hypothetical protein
MKHIHQFLLLFVALAFARAAAAQANNAQVPLEDILSRTSRHVTRLVDQFSNVQCLEKVEQEKLRPDGKIERKEESSFNYLILLTDNSGELSLQESRIAVHEAKADKKNTPMLLSNGFATLFLVFHPAYAAAFHFADAGQEVINGRPFERITFQHISGMRSPAALALRGREYPLELSGTAWIDTDSGAIAKIQAGIGDTLTDVGLKSLNSEIEFVPQKFGAKNYWLPVLASVDVETPRQHWHNIHHFADYKAFSVSSEEVDKKVAQK